MTRRSLVLTLFVVGSVLLLLILWWRWPSAGSTSEGGTADRPAQFAASTQDFDADPGRLGVDEVVSRVGQGVLAAVRDEAALREQGGSLAERVEVRAGLLLAPDFERWRELVRADGGTLPDWAQGETVDEEALERWERAAEGLRAAPVAPSGITVRTIAIDEPAFLPVPGTRFMRPTERVSATYETPPEHEGTTAVEVLVPVRFGTVSGPRIPATVSMRFYREVGESDWKPFDMIVYFDEQSMGKTLQFPIF